MEGTNGTNNLKFVRSFEACDIRVSIDDLNLLLTFRTSKEQLMRFYPVDHIPVKILAAIHHDRGEL